MAQKEECSPGEQEGCTCNKRGYSSIMETCPHGARIVLEDGKPVVFVDECQTCSTLLSELGFAGKIMPREKVTTAA